MGLFGGGGLIGIDVGASSIKILKGKRARSCFEVEKFVAVPLPPRSMDERGIINAEAVNNGIAAAVTELGERGAKVASAVGGLGVLTKRIVIPKIPKKDIPDQVRWEAEQVFPQDVASILVDFIEIGEGAQVPGAPEGTPGWELLLVGVRAEEAAALRMAIEGARASVKVMDLEAFAAADFLQGLVEAPSEGAAALVDVGATGTRVTFVQGKKVVFIRDFAIGGNAFTEAISQSLGVSFEDAESLKIQDGAGIPAEAQNAIHSVINAWVGELQQCEDLYISQDARALVARWYVFGGGAQTPGFMDRLRSERFGDKVFPLPASELIKAKGKKVDAALLAAWSPRLVTAAGLGCRKE